MDKNKTSDVSAVLSSSFRGASFSVRKRVLSNAELVGEILSKKVDERGREIKS